MPLRHEPDVVKSDWFVLNGAPWTQLCSLGPSGFERYCRLFHPLHEGADENDPDELLNVEGDLDRTHLDRLTAILSRHTSTPGDCYFGLWDGFGDIHGSPAVGFLRSRGHSPPAEIPPAFPSGVLAGPRVVIPPPDLSALPGAACGDWRVGRGGHGAWSPSTDQQPQPHLARGPRMVRGKRDRSPLDRCCRQISARRRTSPGHDARC
jgi:hypothetical protein